MATFTELSGKAYITKSSQEWQLRQYKTWKGDQASIGKKGECKGLYCRHRLSDLVVIISFVAVVKKIFL